MENFELKSSIEEFGSGGFGVAIYIKYPGDSKADFEKQAGVFFMDAEQMIIDNMKRIFYSKDPERQKLRNQKKEKMISLFNQPIYVEEIPNGYCSNGCCADKPWFIVTTKIGRIKIGWRKRVINIDWSDSENKTEAKVLFPDEDVTKYDRDIHACSYEKAKEYLDKIIG